MTRRPGQAPFPGRLQLSAFLLWAGIFVGLTGCQTTQPPVAVAPAVTPPSTVKPVFKPRRAEPVQPLPTQPHAGAPIIPQPLPAPVVEVQKPRPVSPVTAVTLQNGRLTQVSNEGWVAVPLRDDRRLHPSLLEDAMITSNLNTRLKSLPATRNANIQCRSSQGRVALKAGLLTPAQAVAAVEQALRFEKVVEVRLDARIQE